MDAQETNIYHAILITSVVLGIIIVFFIISITRQQRKNLELHRLNILAEITALEKERSRIASDLHDELGPVLSAVKMKINSFELHDEEDRIQMEKTNVHIDDLLQRIRDISFDLMPNSLIRKGLIPALREFVDYLNNDSSISFVFTSETELQVNEQKAVNIYRIVQEIAHNTIKHSGASRLSINVKMVNKYLQMNINDDGVGFEYEKKASETMGFGLRGLVSRTEVIGGQMYLDSVPGKGTNYSFEIPI
ncbi:MAG TPA: ATP-binding protein [Ferruginibacter sp.]|nr:ATP-binding protein [Ferruginibacter sp.]